MPKQAKSSTAKIRQICREYPNEFSATPAGELRCNLCDVLVKCDKKCFVESHRKSKQTFLQFDQVNFNEQVVSSFLAADITLHKLNCPSLKSLFATMRKVLSLETAAWACVAKVVSRKEQIQELLRDKNFFQLWMKQRLLNKSILMCLWAA